jgi:methylmalonyl-CoA mutase N-terminal domain/subunit
VGGTLRAIETGFIQREIQNSAYAYQRAVEERKKIIVGVNQFQAEGPAVQNAFRVDPRLEQEQVERLRDVRASRSEEAVRAALGELHQAARGTSNLLPRIFECCRSFVTVGEISQTLRQVFGEHRETF